MSDRDKKPRFQRAPGKGRDAARRPAWRDREARSDGPVILYGWHTGAAALGNPQRKVRKLLVAENAGGGLAGENIDTRVTPESVRPNLIAQGLGAGAVDQVRLAEAGAW